MKVTKATPIKFLNKALPDEMQDKFGDIELDEKQVEEFKKDFERREIKRKDRDRKIKRQEIFNQLDAIDRKSVRSLRVGDTVRLAEQEAEAKALRQKLKEI